MSLYVVLWEFHKKKMLFGDEFSMVRYYLRVHVYFPTILAFEPNIIMWYICIKINTERNISHIQNIVFI